MTVWSLTGLLKLMGSSYLETLETAPGPKQYFTEHLHIFFSLLIPTKIVLPALRAQTKQPPLCVGLPPLVTTQHQADYVWQLKWL